MLLAVLFTMTAGIEAGVNQPIIGYDDLTAGAVFNFQLEKNAGFSDLGFGIQGAFYQGKNQAYSQHAYGFRFLANKNNWLFSPVLEAGADYIRRQMGYAQETGFSFNYLVGMRVNLRYQLLTVYPFLYFEGVTDLQAHAGFVGIKIGIKHEL
jgi:hypothetical protein